MALDLRGDEPRLVRTCEDMYRFMRGRKQLMIVERYDERLGHRTDAEPRECIAKFFVRYIGKQALSGVIDESYIDQFINSDDEDDRQKSGNFIIDVAIHSAVEPISSHYRKALGRGLLRPKLKVATDAVTEILPRKRWSEYHDILRMTLVA